MPSVPIWMSIGNQAINGGPEPEVTQKFSISTVISTITSDTNMERKTIQMDRHKWFIRTVDGLLDILTGHVGGTVPELFLSDRKLGVEFSRAELLQFANATPDLASTPFNCRIVTTEELEGKLNENRVKQITGNSCVTFRNTYESSQGGIPTAKLFTTTNNLPDCRATEAFQDRVVAIPFMSRFVNDSLHHFGASTI
ncbi:SF3 helicase domain-containing protein [Trichonephila clavata]|uniref:SF3 helicase domain-containing protein n=1 Tax=Trichonephila clavata TaxID=2740835 RepID=A0A8X6J506_TRICU|nr:SF3 helicase domain-containing protein [Trichonephila clavata]